METAAPELLTVKEFCARHPWAKPGGIRHVLFYANTNGLRESGAIARLGRRILLDEGRFVAWMRQRGQQGN